MPNPDHSNLMETIGMNDSFDTSSDDQIPMQRTSRKRSSRNSYSRRRNNRVGLSSSPLFKSNYRHGFYTLLKLTFIILSVASLILCLSLCYNLYSRFELLQETLDRVQSSNINTPEEMHEVHSHLQLIDTNVTRNKATINNIIEKLTNLTSDVTTMEGKLNKILEFVQTAPEIAKLPKDVQELKSLVTEIGSKMNTDDKEIRINSEKQAQHSVRLDTMDDRIKLLEGNISDVSFKTTTKFASSFTSVQADMQKLNSVVSNISNYLDILEKSQKKLAQWKIKIDDQINDLKQINKFKMKPIGPDKKILEANNSNISIEK